MRSLEGVLLCHIALGCSFSSSSFFGLDEFAVSLMCLPSDGVGMIVDAGS